MSDTEAISECAAKIATLAEHLERMDSGSGDAHALRLCAQYLAQQQADIAALEAERDALQAFKIYVHNRLTLAGIATHPDGPHTKQGCRIGDRLDIVLAERDALRSTLLAAHHAIVSLDEEIFGPIMDAHGEHCGWVRDELLAQMRARLG